MQVAIESLDLIIQDRLLIIEVFDRKGLRCGPTGDHHCHEHTERDKGKHSDEHAHPMRINRLFRVGNAPTTIGNLLLRAWPVLEATTPRGHQCALALSLGRRGGGSSACIAARWPTGYDRGSLLRMTRIVPRHVRATQ